jgi:hypothetical protein
MSAEPSSDPVHDSLTAAYSKPITRCLWTKADAVTFTRPVLKKAFGDGRALFHFTTMNDRPKYWVIRGDSNWGCADLHQPDDAPDFGDFTDEIIDEIIDEFGTARCGYSGENLRWPVEERSCHCENCQGAGEYGPITPEDVEFPAIDPENGCSWGRLKWPGGFDVVPHPFARGVMILAECERASDGCESREMPA